MQPINIGIRIKNKTEILPLCLQALSFQTIKPFDIFIYDESDVPVTDSSAVRLCFDLLQIHHNIDIIHRRRIESQNVAQALIKLIDYTIDHEYQYLLMLDSDMILTPNCLKILYSTLINSEHTIFVEPTVIDINNSLNHKDYSVKKYGKKDVNKFSQWGINHQYFETPMRIKRKVTTASIPLINMNHVNIRNLDIDIKESLNQLGNLPGEDIVMYYHLTHETVLHGLLCTNARAYHFSHTSQGRDWYNVTRQLQDKISKGGLT